MGRSTEQNGQPVNVTLQPVPTDGQDLSADERLRRAFGGWAENGEELDEFLQWNRQQRKTSRREISP